MEGLVITQIIVLLLLMEMATNVIHYSIAYLISLETKRWHAPIGLIVTTLGTKGCELALLSLFSFWHHAIYVVRDVSMIIVALTPVMTRIAAKAGVSFVDRSSETYVARYLNIYTGEVFTESLQLVPTPINEYSEITLEIPMHNEEK